MNTYRVFTRSATNWEQFARARKRTVRRGLSYEEAQLFCLMNNSNRNAAQQRRGFKYEFEQE